MPIEFSCPQCGSLLRTPDTSAGKKAKCPHCGSVSEVPAGGAAAAEEWRRAEAPPFSPEADMGQAVGSNPWVPPQADNPFAEPASPFAAHKPAAWENPYATPAPAADLYAPAAAQRELIVTRIDFGRTLSASWRIFAENLGLLVLLALMLFGLVILTYLLLVGMVVGVMFGVGEGQPDPSVLLVLIPVAVVLGIVALFAYSWLEAGLAIVAIGVCRGRPVQFNEVFSGGRYTLQVVLLNVIRTIINVVIGVVFGLLGTALAAAMRHEAYSLVGSLLGNVANYVVTLLLLLTTYFIVDHGLSVGQAMGASMRFMNGNKLTVFAIHIVVGICSVLAVLLTCGIGMLFVLPYFLVLTAAIYLLSTGQPLAGYAESATR